MTAATTPRERPIIFGAESIRAVLAGTKTQTRRLLRHDGLNGVPPTEKWGPWEETCTPGFWLGCNEDGTTIAARCPYGTASDRLWVREPWGTLTGRESETVYRADSPDAPVGVWSPPIYLPRERSRIMLEVVSVRVEQLQKIKPSDAIAEGVFAGDHYATRPPLPYPVATFASLWDTINGRRAPWDSNPFVWVISFRRAAP